MTDSSRSTGRSQSANNGTSPVLAALRDATAQRHELLHEIMPLSVDSVALRDYVEHLAILRDWLEPLEAWLDSFDDGPQAADVAPRIERVALIDADLSHTSVKQQDLAVAARASGPARAWSGRMSAAYRWGVCYVIEGSQLGGAVLHARLHERLAPHPLGFLNAGRDALASRWRKFTGTMAAQIHTSGTIDDACRGAAEAFDRLIELAQRPGRAARAGIVSESV